MSNVSWYGDHRDLHVPTPSSPPPRSSDLCRRCAPRTNCLSSASRCAAACSTERPSSAPIRSPRCAESAAASPYPRRSEEHTSELQSLMRISYAVFCLQKKTTEQYAWIHPQPGCTLFLTPCHHATTI